MRRRLSTLLVLGVVLSLLLAACDNSRLNRYDGSDGHAPDGQGSAAHSLGCPHPGATPPTATAAPVAAARQEALPLSELGPGATQGASCLSRS